LIYFPGLVPTTFPAVADFLTGSEYARARLAVADEVLGYSLIEAYEKAEVYDWEVFEAGFMALSLALADWATDHLDLDPVVYGGQSFGAIVGAVYAGVLDYAEALRLVRESTRVELDYFGSLAEPVGCFFFYRLASHEVDRLVARCLSEGHRVEGSIYLDNSVHAVSGTMTGLQRLRELVLAEGGHAFYLMNRAEHCSMVSGLRDRLEEEVYGRLSWRRSWLPMVSDVTGKLLTDPQEVRGDLLDGWVTPVYWSTVADGIRASGAVRAFVIGPRTMFSRLTSDVVPTAVITPKAVQEFPREGFALPVGAGGR
jgi:[acyl-carrier-protein] S-malonyltransferase